MQSIGSSAGLHEVNHPILAHKKVIRTSLFWRLFPEINSRLRKSLCMVYDPHLELFYHINNHTIILLLTGNYSIIFLWAEFSLSGMRRKTEPTKPSIIYLFHLLNMLFLIRTVSLLDIRHTKEEERFYCIGHVADGIITVRFTDREDTIRIYGAGYWRKGRKIYEEQNKIYR